MRRRWFLTLAALVAATTMVVAFILGWKPLLERIQLGEARHILGSWEFVSVEPREDSPTRRVHFSTQLKGFLELQLQATVDQSPLLDVGVQGDDHTRSQRRRGP